MSVKFFILIFIVGFVFADGKKSFVVVIDTTASMRDEIYTLKDHMEFVVKSLQYTSNFQNYIIVPFTDPDVGIPKISLTPERLLNSLSELEVKGGLDCPENSLAAIEKALDISRDFSNIFLFTDATPKDIDKLPFIQTLCRQKQSQVVIFLSGECPGEPGNSMNIYYEIAKFCSGAVFHFDIQHLRQAFMYMKEIASVEWTNINTHREFTGTKLFTFNVDNYTKDIVVAVAGDYPEIKITNAIGQIAEMKRIVDTKHALVVRMLVPLIGEYKAEICSRGISMTSFYKWKTIAFRYGFSPKMPRDLDETSDTPIPDALSYLLIEQLDSSIEPFLLEVQDDDEKAPLELEVVDENKGQFMVQDLFKDKPFRIIIHGRQKSTHEVIKGYSKVITPQLKVRPRRLKSSVDAIKIESSLVEFMTNVTLFCKVTGDPKPEIWWEDDNGNKLDSEDVLFQWPSTYISYGTINNVTTNTTVHCKAKNSKEEISLSTDLFVHREFTFEVLQSPTDMTIQYGDEGQLFCQANAYPEATIKWYHNGSIIDNTDTIAIVPEDNMLLIKNMTLDNTGEYKCEATNEVETKTFTAIVDVSGLESPLVEVTESELILRPGDESKVECRVIKGSPTPEVTWKKVVYDEYVDFPDGIYVEGNVLKITSAKGEDSGMYKCEASNVVGEEFKEVVLRVHYAPIIKKSDEEQMVNVGVSVQLGCDVDAEPKAAVHWDMYQGDVIITFDDRHYTDDRNTHHFIAQPNDSGTYHCIAENDMGKAERRVTINVLEAPFIEPLEFKNITARVGGSLSIPCNVLVGHPVPNTRWEFISPKSSITISRETTTKLNLVLRNLSKANEGFYQCVTENNVAPDSVKFYLKVLQ